MWYMGQLLRVKKNIRIFEEDQELFFIKSYGKAIIVGKSHFVTRLVEKTQEQKERDHILFELADEFKTEYHVVEQLVDKLVDVGALETYSKQTINDRLYEQYETQLSFFDLLQPAGSVEEQLTKQIQLGRLHILIIGVGGIGNYVVLSLAAMGLGKLTIIDGDVIELSNLNRQVIFNQSDIGQKKSYKVMQKVRELNPGCHVKNIDAGITSKEEAFLHLLNQGIPDLVFISADKPDALPGWVNEVASVHGFPFVKCSYQGSTGFIGPIIEPKGKLFSEIIAVMKEDAEHIPAIRQHNQAIKHASSSPSNAIFANIAVLECIKYLLKIPGVNILERRMFFDLERMNIYYE
jgi:molybdopterin/thiamine biosynthesis adenylyltransferase